MAGFTENRTLLRRFQAGDPAALESLVRVNEPLVMKIALHYYKPGAGLELADLQQEGRLGLLTAARKFDLTRGIQFSTYATLWVQQAVRRAVRQATLIHVPENQHYRPHEAELPSVVASLDQAVDDGDDRLEDMIADPHDLETSTVTVLFVAEVLAVLPELEHTVLALRYGLDGEGQRSLNEISQVARRSREGVRHIEQKALARIRAAVG